jgi:hypothetical protein
MTMLTFSPRRSSKSEFTRSSELLEIKSRLFQNASIVGASSYSKAKMRAVGICAARSFSGQKIEFSADVQFSWSTFKPGTKTRLYYSIISRCWELCSVEDRRQPYSNLASAASLTILMDILKYWRSLWMLCL